MKIIEALVSVLKEDPSLIWALVFLFQILLSGVIGFFLAFRLNPRFDPLLKKSLEYLEYVPNFTTYFMRTGIYIMYIVDKRLGGDRPEIKSIDFRKGLSRATIFWCYVEFINGSIILIVWTLGLGGYQLLKRYF